MLPNADVSVVIPTYNSSQTILETLQSVFAQTIQPLEILVIDDCSSDDTVSLVAACSEVHPLVRVIQQDRNVGVTGTRNKGILQAKATWVALLDADDLWTPDKLEKQLAYAAEHPELDAIGCYYTELFGSRLGSVRSEFFWQSALLLRRSAAAAILFNPGWRTADLPEFWSRFDTRYTRGGVSESLMKYRLNLSGLAHKTFFTERKAWLLVGENVRRRAAGLSEVPFAQIDLWYRRAFPVGRRVRDALTWRGDFYLREALFYAKTKRYLQALFYAACGAILSPLSVLTKFRRASSLFTSAAPGSSL